MSSNADPKLTLEYGEEDVLLLLDAFALARNTALFYGEHGAATRKRWEDFIAQVSQHSPVPHKHRAEGYAYFVALQRLRTWAGSYTAIYKIGGGDRAGDVYIRIGSLRYKVAERVPRSDIEDLFVSLKEKLSRLSGIEAVWENPPPYDDLYSWLKNEKPTSNPT